MSYFRFSGFGLVGKSGLEPLNSYEDRFTVCCNCHYATSPLNFFHRWLRCFSSRRRDSNPRQADYKSATLPTELHRLFDSFFKQLFLSFWGCKDTSFSNSNKIFFHFPCKLLIICLIFNTKIKLFFISILFIFPSLLPHLLFFCTFLFSAASWFKKQYIICWKYDSYIISRSVCHFYPFRITFGIH